MIQYAALWGTANTKRRAQASRFLIYLPVCNIPGKLKTEQSIFK